MVDSLDIGRKISSSFVDRMEGGAFAFSADDEQKLVYVNDNLIRLFECKDADDLLAYVGGRLEGMIHDPAPSIILNEISRQVEESKNGSGYVFYNTKSFAAPKIFCNFGVVKARLHIILLMLGMMTLMPSICFARDYRDSVVMNRLWDYHLRLKEDTTGKEHNTYLVYRIVANRRNFLMWMIPMTS